MSRRSRTLGNAVSAAIGLRGQHLLCLYAEPDFGRTPQRDGLTCCAAVYALYNIAYALGQIAASGFAPAASASLGFFRTPLFVRQRRADRLHLDYSPPQTSSRSSAQS